MSSRQTERSYPTKPQAVYFFATCVIDQFQPKAGLHAIQLLEREGLAVHFPEDQTCCGQPAYTSGFPDEARAVAKQQIALFTEPWPIVVPSGSCAGMIRHHYPTLFADDPEMHTKALALSERIFEFTEFLVHILHYHPTDLGTPCTIAVHTSCSARREMNTHLNDRKLLGELGNVHLVTHDHETECCGFGGTFAVRQPDISGAMVRDKLHSLKETGAEEVVSADCGCLLNILGHAEHEHAKSRGQQTGLVGEHIASFLWKRTGGKA